MKKTVLPNTFVSRKRLWTKSLVPGQLFGEATFRQDGEYREFDPKRSKLAAAFQKGVREFRIRPDSLVLYLGASHGQTPSHVSDMVADGGVFCVEFSPTVCRDLVFVCEQRENMAPLLADASKPDAYADIVPDVDVVYQDIAQKGQVDIFLKNLERYGKPGSTGLLALKAKSVDAMKKSREVFKEVRERLEKTDWLEVVEQKSLHPYEKDHAFYVVRRNP